MTEEEEQEEKEEEEESFAYADYSGVVVMIQTYYYKTLELFRQYYLLTLKGIDHKPLKQKIQSYVIIVVQLLRNYDPLKKDKKIKDIFLKINKFAGTGKLFNFDRMKKCIDSMVDAHYILGLSKLEFKKYRKQDALENYRKGL